jgi:hypothetical protein
MHGDINATELYQDTAFLERVGMGMLDVPFGSSGAVGFEDVVRFSYLNAEQMDPKLYRRKVFELTGHYYPNDLAVTLWSEFAAYQNYLQKKSGQEFELRSVATDWLNLYGHDFIKQWALHRPEVAFRIRNLSEPRLSWLTVLVVMTVPAWRELIQTGFNPLKVAFTSLFTMGKKGNDQYLHLVARLSKLPICSDEDARNALIEVKLLEQQLRDPDGNKVSFRAATIEYFRRLKLVVELEDKSPIALAMVA